MLIVEHITVKPDGASAKTFGIEIAAGPTDGKRYPVVIVLHGNGGLTDWYGPELRKLTEAIQTQGYVAALPTYYGPSESHIVPPDSDVETHVPVLAASIQHLGKRKDVDIKRIGLVGFSLGGGVAASYISNDTSGAIKVFVDYYGYVQSVLSRGVDRYPPTRIFSHLNDPAVPPKANSEALAELLQKKGIEHEPKRDAASGQYKWFENDWEFGLNHPFRPGSEADNTARIETAKWLKRHMAPTGV